MEPWLKPALDYIPRWLEFQMQASQQPGCLMAIAYRGNVVLERAFGLATVRLHTAAAATDARIPGLEREEAARLRDSLAELGEAQAAGL